MHWNRLHLLVLGTNYIPFSRRTNPNLKSTGLLSAKQSIPITAIHESEIRSRCAHGSHLWGRPHDSLTSAFVNSKSPMAAPFTQCCYHNVKIYAPSRWKMPSVLPQIIAAFTVPFF